MYSKRLFNEYWLEWKKPYWYLNFFRISLLSLIHETSWHLHSLFSPVLLYEVVFPCCYWFPISRHHTMHTIYCKIIHTSCVLFLTLMRMAVQRFILFSAMHTLFFGTSLRRILLLYFHFILAFCYIVMVWHLCSLAHTHICTARISLFSRHQFHSSDIRNGNYDMVSALNCWTTVHVIRLVYVETRIFSCIPLCSFIFQCYSSWFIRLYFSYRCDVYEYTVDVLNLFNYRRLISLFICWQEYQQWKLYQNNCS